MLIIGISLLDIDRHLSRGTDFFAGMDESIKFNKKWTFSAIISQ